MQKSSCFVKKMLLVYYASVTAMLMERYEVK